MKDQFNKIFPLLIKQEKNAAKTQILAILDSRHCPQLQSCVISRKINDANLRK